ncbi:MAG: dephospho-CoA kinase [Rhodobacterales bacterium]|nr:MAG: dephospho-CoA kinase [Rhodobacterales bacterium]
MTAQTIIALTGSIGMGKSTTAQIFADLGIPVWDADATVHRLYGKNGKAVPEIARLHPEAVKDGAVDRTALKRWIEKDPQAFAKIEKVVHPLIAEDRLAFLDRAEEIVVLDIPLLFETGADDLADVVVVASIDPQTQEQRVLTRGTMSEEMFHNILAKQVPDAVKRARADYIVTTDTPDHARQQVVEILESIRGRQTDA